MGKCITPCLVLLQSLLAEAEAETAGSSSAAAVAGTPQQAQQGQGQPESSGLAPVTPAPARRDSLASMLKKQKAMHCFGIHLHLQNQHLPAASLGHVQPVLHFSPKVLLNVNLKLLLHASQAPLSGAQRQQQLLGGDQKGKRLAGTPQARGLGVRHQHKPRLAVRLTGFLQQAVSKNLAQLPSGLAGAHPPHLKSFLYIILSSR